MKHLIAIAGIALIFASCNSRFEKTPSGLTYKIIEGSGKQKLKPGQIIKINGIVKITPRDSVMFTTYGHMPEYLPFDSSAKGSYDFNEVLPMASVGDSIVTVAEVDTLVKRGMAQYSDVLKKGDKIQTSIKILAVFATNEEQAADYKKEMESEKQREVAAIESFLKKKNITAQKTENGVFVVVKDAGQGPKAAMNQQLTVNYTGSLMETGKTFDSNLDSTYGHMEPLKFVTGTGQMIRAFDEGFQYFGKGGKGTIYVPSMMGYGPPGRAPQIPPYAPLVFDVELVDISAAPVQQQMPGMDPRQLQQGNPQQGQPQPQN